MACAVDIDNGTENFLDESKNEDPAIRMASAWFFVRCFEAGLKFLDDTTCEKYNNTISDFKTGLEEDTLDDSAINDFSTILTDVECDIEKLDDDNIYGAYVKSKHSLMNKMLKRIHDIDEFQRKKLCENVIELCLEKQWILHSNKQYRFNDIGYNDIVSELNNIGFDKQLITYALAYVKISEKEQTKAPDYLFNDDTLNRIRNEKYKAPSGGIHF